MIKKREVIDEETDCSEAKHMILISLNVRKGCRRYLL
jgi:hypothetical protein